MKSTIPLEIPKTPRIAASEFDPSLVYEWAHEMFCRDYDSVNQVIEGNAQNYDQFYGTEYAGIVTVAKSGGDYTLVQDAINSILDATATYRYAVLIYPGIYEEQVTAKEYVDLIAVSEATIQYAGTSVFTGANNCVVSGINFIQSAFTGSTYIVYASGSASTTEHATTDNFYNSLDCKGYDCPPEWASQWTSEKGGTLYGFIGRPRDSSHDTSGFSYIKFNVDDLPSTITSAILYVKRSNIGNPNSGPLWVYSTTGAWNSATITWDTAPTLGSQLDSLGSGEGWKNITATSTFQGIKDGTHTGFRLGHVLDGPPTYAAGTADSPYAVITGTMAIAPIILLLNVSMVFRRCTFSGVTTYSVGIYNIGLNSIVDLFECDFSSLKYGVRNSSGYASTLRIRRSNSNCTTKDIVNEGSGTIFSGWNRIVGAGINLDNSGGGTFYSIADNYTTSSGTITILGSVGNTDTVDNYHASATPSANTIYPLNSSAVFPHEVGGLEADVSAYNGLVKISGGATSAIELDTDGSLAANSDTKVASQKATKTYADTKIAKSIGTAKGSLIGFSASAMPVELGVGTTGKFLKADSGEISGLKWESVPGGGDMLKSTYDPNDDGIFAIIQGGTGQTTASTAINALLPSQSGQANKFLKTDGTDVSWAIPSGSGGSTWLEVQVFS